MMIDSQHGSEKMIKVLLVFDNTNKNSSTNSSKLNNKGDVKCKELFYG